MASVGVRSQKWNLDSASGRYASRRSASVFQRLVIEDYVHFQWHFVSATKFQTQTKRDNVMVLCILIFTYSDGKTESSQLSLNFLEVAAVICNLCS